MLMLLRVLYAKVRQDSKMGMQYCCVSICPLPASSGRSCKNAQYNYFAVIILITMRSDKLLARV